MARTSQARLAGSFAGILLVLVFCPAPVGAIPLYTTDIDSLVYLSTDIVVAEIIRRYDGNVPGLVDVKLLSIHKGQFTKGSTIPVAYSQSYCKPGFNPVPLDVGDRLVLFLTPLKDPNDIPPPGEARLYAPVMSGVKLIQGGNVYGFEQRANPGPYVANLEQTRFSKIPVPSVARFKEQLTDSLRSTRNWSRLLEAERVDAAALLKLLADRRKITDTDFDHIGELICVRLAELRDPEILCQALLLVGHRQHGARILGYGLARPAGREALLSKVCNPEEALKDRIRYACALASAGLRYRSVITKIGLRSTESIGPADPGNSAYVRRIVQAALDYRRDTELCLALLGCINQPDLLPWLDDDVATDLRETVPLLVRLRESAPGEEVKGAVQTVLEKIEKMALTDKQPQVETR